MMTIGIDEVGRGCWAGPLLAAAVLLDPARPIAGLNDSKKLTKSRRELLAVEIREKALAIGIGWVWPTDIDTSGITLAVKSSMTQAVQALHAECLKQGINFNSIEIIIDGNYNFLPEYPKASTLIAADGLIPPVSAASIIAKVTRDTYMATEAARDYSQYGFEKHVGYGTTAHIAALKQFGVTPIHRYSYKPIKAMLQSSA